MLSQQNERIFVILKTNNMANIFSSLKNAYKLFKHIDFDKLDALSRKVDLPKMVDTISNLDDKQLSGMMKMMGGSGKKKELPPIEGDFYHLGDEALNEEDRALQLKVRAFLEKEVSLLSIITGIGQNFLLRLSQNLQN